MMNYNIFENYNSNTIIIMEEFHDYIMMLLTIIISYILIVMIKIMLTKSTNYNFKENTNLEIIWTVLPMMILFLIAYPSLFYLYLFDLSTNPVISFKVIGAQWYWIYETLNENNEEMKSYSSYMIQDSELIKENKYKMGWRLLETDTRLIFPSLTEIQCISTSLDVIHSFSIPSLGVKIDAIPGRLNSINFMVISPGLYYGQCAEICGTGHSFMPISIEVI